jgi:hypothetical protein
MAKVTLLHPSMMFTTSKEVRGARSDGYGFYAPSKLPVIQIRNKT